MKGFLIQKGITFENKEDGFQFYIVKIFLYFFKYLIIFFFIIFFFYFIQQLKEGNSTNLSNEETTTDSLFMEEIEDEEIAKIQHPSEVSPITEVSRDIFPPDLFEFSQNELEEWRCTMLKNVQFKTFNNFNSLQSQDPKIYLFALVRKTQITLV